MKLPALLFVSLSVAAFPSALSASLNSAEEDGVAAQHDGLTELQKIDQMEFEAAQRNEAARKNVTEEQKDDSGHHHGEGEKNCCVLEMTDQGDEQSAAEGDGKEQRSGTSHAPEDSESSEETEGRQRRDEITVDSTKERDGQCSTTGPSVRGGGGPDDAGAQGELQ
ncbi:hypothetical protein D4764_20G0000460 [Takifugu flavidus]|uniref:Uncharacterized protein n=1 Tax=Takifugu flavidus TaxID=433684 RepID=A0A5C6NES0_9TELE|nr:hypothetical protein D4764_20G0000460 [Takifugu flavidus]